MVLQASMFLQNDGDGTASLPEDCSMNAFMLYTDLLMPVPVAARSKA